MLAHQPLPGTMVVTHLRRLESRQGSAAGSVQSVEVGGAAALEAMPPPAPVTLQQGLSRGSSFRCSVSLVLGATDTISHTACVND